VFPLLAEALQGRQLSVGEPYFDDMTRPIGFALLFLMAVAPLLPWRAANVDLLHRRLVGAAVASAAMVVAVGAGLRGVAPVLVIGLGTLALAGIARQIVLAIRAHRRRNATGWLSSGAAVMAGNRRLYGGLVVHSGVVLIAVALAMSSAFTADREARLGPGEGTRVRGYEVTYLDSGSRQQPGRTIQSARFAITKGDRDLGVYAPAITQFRGSSQAIGTPSVRTGLLEDVYLTLIRGPDDKQRVTVGVRVNPMIVWLWIGVAVMAVGTAVAGWPSRRGARRGRIGDQQTLRHDNAVPHVEIVEPAGTGRGR
jgi:cytochrome c-type biogenesis protein CcmF